MMVDVAAFAHAEGLETIHVLKMDTEVCTVMAHHEHVCR